MRALSASAVVLAAVSALLGSACAEDGPGTAVRATLEDGQVLVGEVHTGVVVLEGALGTLSVPWEDVGEVTPVEGGDLAASNGHVTLWLKNGSELVGRWADPELTMGLTVGGEDFAVDMPVERLQRFQLQGRAATSNSRVARVRTLHGDDLLVDPEVSRLPIEGDLGLFSPFLSEIASAVPIGTPDGPWTVTLRTGTVLIGEIPEESLTFALPMGPEEVSIPVNAIASLEWESWADDAGFLDYANGISAPEASAGGQGDTGWFSSAPIRMQKK